MDVEFNPTPGRPWLFTLEEQKTHFDLTYYALTKEGLRTCTDPDPEPEANDWTKTTVAYDYVDSGSVGPIEGDWLLQGMMRDRHVKIRIEGDLYPQAFRLFSLELAANHIAYLAIENESVNSVPSQWAKSGVQVLVSAKRSLKHQDEYQGLLERLDDIKIRSPPPHVGWYM